MPMSSILGAPSAGAHRVEVEHRVGRRVELRAPAQRQRAALDDARVDDVQRAERLQRRAAQDAEPPVPRWSKSTSRRWASAGASDARNEAANGTAAGPGRPTAPAGSRWRPCAASSIATDSFTVPGTVPVRSSGTVTVGAAETRALAGTGAW